MKWTAQTIATRLLWLAVALALGSALLAGAISIRTPHALAGAGFLSYMLPGLVFAALLAGSAYGTERNPQWTIPLSAIITLIGFVALIVVALTLGYVCFNISPGEASRVGCTGTFGSEWLAGTSIICLAACPVVSLLALVVGIIAAVRRHSPVRSH